MIHPRKYDGPSLCLDLLDDRINYCHLKSEQTVDSEHESTPMKEIFFKGLAVALPIMVLAGLVYLIFHGFYALYADIQLKKELEKISRESVKRRQQQPKPDDASDSTLSD